MGVWAPGHAMSRGRPFGGAPSAGAPAGGTQLYPQRRCDGGAAVGDPYPCDPSVIRLEMKGPGGQCGVQWRASSSGEGREDRDRRDRPRGGGAWIATNTFSRFRSLSRHVEARPKFYIC